MVKLGLMFETNSVDLISLAKKNYEKDNSPANTPRAGKEPVGKSGLSSGSGGSRYIELHLLFLSISY